MKYKLTKEYPNSEKAGTIFTKDERGQYIKENPLVIIQEEYIKNYPEFWEEVKEKEYTILSFISTDESKTINKLQADGGYGEKFSDFSLNEMLKGTISVEDGRFKIHSVRRESDSETFQLGDKVTDRGTYFEITNFEIGEYIIGGMYACGKNVKVSINLIKHDKRRKPILVTEDGKEIFEGDDYSLFSVWTEGDSWPERRYNARQTSYLSKEWKHFHTKEAREEYIKWNKPMYSLNDIKNSQGSFEMVSKIINALEKLGRK